MPEDANANAASFDAVRERLDAIAEEVACEDIALDDALALYEEAVKLGLLACDLSESDLASAAAQAGEEEPREAVEVVETTEADEAAPAPDTGSQLG